MLQGRRDISTVAKTLLDELTPLVEAQLGVIYQMDTSDNPMLQLVSSYADHAVDGHKKTIRLGEGLDRPMRREQAASADHQCSERRSDHVGFDGVDAKDIIVLPVLFENEVKASSSFPRSTSFTELQIAFLEQLTANIGIVLNSIEATMQTEGLLKQSQQLAAELQTQQKELQQTNEQLEQKARELAEQNVEVERKNQEIDRPARGGRKGGRNSRSRPSTSPNSSPTCRMSCAHR